MTQESPEPKSGHKPSSQAPSFAPEASGDGNAKKERVLHTRVPAVLERELKRLSDNFRVPVSNLVRAILEDAVNVAELAGTNVEDRLRNAAKTLEAERERLKKRVQKSAGDRTDGIFAFQDVTLAQPADCARCGRSLPRGTRAHLGMTDGASPRDRRAPNVIVCASCLPRE